MAVNELRPFDDPRLLEQVTTAESDESDDGIHGPLSPKRICDEFLSLLAVCNEVIPDFPDCEKNCMEKGVMHAKSYLCDAPVIYQSASPDENALVAAAKRLQYYLHVKKKNSIKIKLNVGVMKMGTDLYKEKRVGIDRKIETRQEDKTSFCVFRFCLG